MDNVIGVYRGKRVDNGEWIEGNVCIGEDRSFILKHSKMWQPEEDRYDDHWSNYEVDKNTIGQQTPFTCRYGQPLFQGMRVKCEPTEEFKDEGQSTRTIGMSKNGQWVCFLYDSDGEQESAMPINWGGWRSIEIIAD